MKVCDFVRIYGKKTTEQVYMELMMIGESVNWDTYYITIISKVYYEIVCVYNEK